MTIYSERFVTQIIEKYKEIIPKEYRKYEYLDKSREEQFLEALNKTKYEDIIKYLDEEFIDAKDDGKYDWD